MSTTDNGNSLPKENARIVAEDIISGNYRSIIVAYTVPDSTDRRMYYMDGLPLECLGLVDTAGEFIVQAIDGEAE